MKRWFPAVLLVVAVACVFFLFRSKTPQPQSSNPNVSPQLSTPTNPSRLDASVWTNAPVFSNTPPALSGIEAEERRKAFVRSKIANAPEPVMLEITNIAPQTVMENMRGVFQQYATRFGGNPVGVNQEITAALNGGNSKRVVFIKAEDGLRINDQGELVDSWGTPFFFHQLSAREMEIHSAGPDRVMWTADDLVMK